MESDDSDFYGDVSNASALRERVEKFDVPAWARQQSAKTATPTHSNRTHRARSRLHNPYHGVLYAWQLDETVDDFLKRCPPSTTYCNEEQPWIYICNPYISRLNKGSDSDLTSRGNEDEAPHEEGSNLNILMEGGTDRLMIVANFVEMAQKGGNSTSFVEREIEKERKRATTDLLHLAHMAKVRSGKWMLFCTSDEVNEVWSIVAKATANNELGIAAKVAPKPIDQEDRHDRLICVYTSDFALKEEVGRVLIKLRELRLVEGRAQRIYYKPDAFTYLGIAHGNPWGIKASIYSSVDKFEGPFKP